MRKFIITLLALATIFSVIFVPLSVSAATKEDVLSEFNTIPASHYIYDDIEQLANNHPLTSEQYDKLLEWCKEIKELFPEDKGSSLHSYSSVVQEKALEIMREVADYLELKMDIVPVENAKHRNDIIVKLYDKTGKFIFEYDGDVIRKTDEAESADYVLYAIISASFIVAAFVVFAIISKKRSQKNIAG